MYSPRKCEGLGLSDGEVHIVGKGSAWSSAYNGMCTGASSTQNLCALSCVAYVTGCHLYNTYSDHCINDGSEAKHLPTSSPSQASEHKLQIALLCRGQAKANTFLLARKKLWYMSEKVYNLELLKLAVYNCEYQHPSSFISFAFFHRCTKSQAADILYEVNT